MAPAATASKRPVLDLDDRLFSRSCESLSQRFPVSECTQMQSHLKPKLPDMLIAVDFRDGSSLNAMRVDLYVQ